MFSVATGKLVAGWDPAVGYRVAALAISGNSVYLGGSFGEVDNVVRNRLAAVTLNTGALLAWNPDADDEVYAIDLSDDGTHVFVGGGFTTLKDNDHYALAMVNTTTGNAYSMPAAEAIPPPTPDCTSRVKDIDTLGDKVFVANAGSGVGCYDGVLAANATNGEAAVAEQLPGRDRGDQGDRQLALQGFARARLQRGTAASPTRPACTTCWWRAPRRQARPVVPEHRRGRQPPWSVRWRSRPAATTSGSVATSPA